MPALKHDVSSGRMHASGVISGVVIHSIKSAGSVVDGHDLLKARSLFLNACFGEQAH